VSAAAPAGGPDGPPAMAAALRALQDASCGRPGARVLVVGGRARVGKTTFAAELARRVARQFPHGRVFVGLRDEDGARLRRTARGRRMLLILDDVASEEQVRPILAAAPDAFVVITARRALAGLDGARHLVLDDAGALATPTMPRVAEGLKHALAI
jgi:hypothetical protein